MMNKIYQLITSVQLGGAEIVAMDLAVHCAEAVGQGTELTVVELFSTKNNYAAAKKAELASKNIRVITLFKGTKRLSLVFAPFFLTYYLWKEKPPVIHSHTDLPDLVLSVAIRIFRLLRIPSPKVIRTIHNTQLWRTHHSTGKFTESVFKNEAIVAVSSYAMNAYQQLRKKYNLPVSNDRQIIYNGCAVPRKMPHPFKIDERKINIAFCGRFEDYKGMETLIPAISEIGNLFPDRFLFHLIGDGTYKNQLEQLSKQRSDVCLYDPIPNVSAMLYAFDYLLMPSHFEGLGLISIEASFSGVPVIASYAPGLDETLPENWPLKFYINKPKELYQIIQNIVNHHYDIASLQKKSYDFVNKKFSQNRMILCYSTLYKRVIKNGYSVNSMNQIQDGSMNK